LPRSVAVMLVDSSMTWLFVNTSPEEVRTIPVPAASSFSSFMVVLMSTREGSTPAAMEETSDGLPADDEMDPPELDDPLPDVAPGRNGEVGKPGVPDVPGRYGDPVDGVTLDALVEPGPRTAYPTAPAATRTTTAALTASAAARRL